MWHVSITRSLHTADILDSPTPAVKTADQTRFDERRTQCGVTAEESRVTELDPGV